MNKHTPGPWVVAEEAKIKHPEGTFIAQAQYWPDAYLIAAAPELLETLSTLLAMCDRQVDFNDDGDGLTLERARVLLAKVKGKA
jgi:hypothetical protein